MLHGNTALLLHENTALLAENFRFPLFFPFFLYNYTEESFEPMSSVSILSLFFAKLAILTIKKIILGLEAAVQRFLKKRCSENMQQICRRTPMPKCDFNKATLQLY